MKRRKVQVDPEFMRAIQEEIEDGETVTVGPFQEFAVGDWQRIADLTRERDEALAEVARLRQIERLAKSCATKLSVSYRRHEVEPRAEFDALIRVFGLAK